MNSFRTTGYAASVESPTGPEGRARHRHRGLRLVPGRG